MLPIKLKPMHHYGKFLSADGPPVSQGIGLVRDRRARPNELAASLGDGPVVLMRAHGDSVVGASIHRSSSARPGSRCSANGIIWRCSTASQSI